MATAEQNACTRDLLDAIADFRKEWRKDDKFDDVLDDIDDLEQRIEKLVPAARDAKPDDADASDDDEPKNLKDAADETRRQFASRRRADAGDKKTAKAA